MTLRIPALPRQGYDQREVRSRAIHHWRAREGRIEAMTTPATAPTADQPVFTRAATATGTDVNGGTITAPFHYPAWTWRDSQPHLSLKDITTPNVLYHPWKRPITEMAGLIYFNQSGAIPAAGKSIWYLGQATESGARLWVESNGTRWRVALHDGVSTEVVSNTTVTPADTNAVRLRWEMYGTTAAWTVRIHQAIDTGSGFGAEVSGSPSGAVAISAWDTDTRLYYGSAGGQNAAAVELTEDIIIQASQPTLATLLLEF